MKLLATILGLALLAAPAAAQEIPALTLAPGEAVTIHFDDGGRVGAPERGAATWSRFDLAAARQLAGMTPPDAPMATGIPVAAGDVQPDPIPADQVRLRMLSIAGQHTLLVVENGRGQALSYRARMTARGRTQATDVCVVLPHLPSYEHWTFPIERIELSDFRFVAWAPGRAVTCE